MAEKRGSIAFFSTYRPPVPLDIYSCPQRSVSKIDEDLMTDGESYNYSGCEIPSDALKTIIKNTKLGEEATVDDVDSGAVSGMIFVSERTDSLETLHIALRFTNNNINDDDDRDDDDDDDEDEHENDDPRVMVFNFAHLYRTDFRRKVRMEDSPCFVGSRYLIFVSTVEPNEERRQPWTAVYKTDLRNGRTERLTPEGVSDFSPSVSPSGQKIAVATLEEKEGGWMGEIEDLKTDIVLMDVRDPSNRRRVIRNGGWPSFGSDKIVFFHRAMTVVRNNGKTSFNWGVYRADISSGRETRITPQTVDAMTPAAISSDEVAVAVIRKKLEFNEPRDSSRNYRHIVVYDLTGHESQITAKIERSADHYNPFVITDSGDDVRIGYHRCIGEDLERGEVTEQFDKIRAPHPKEVGLFRVPGVFPTFSKDGDKLAFVDNDFKNVWLAQGGQVRRIFSVSKLQLPESEQSVFSPVWNQDSEKDILYVCAGPAFSASTKVDIYAIINASSRSREYRKLTTKAGSNNAFPSTDPEGTRIVYRSTRDWVDKEYKSPIRPKNLYIMEDARRGEARGRITRLTNGDWTDTHCQWSPNGEWIVFSSTCDKPRSAPLLDNGLDSGYYAVYLIKADDPSVKVRVISSSTFGAGHVNHPVFSPDTRSIVFAADLAGVSVEPISLPLFLHSVRPYGDIFSVEIDDDDIEANQDITEFKRITHSRYENSTPEWSLFTTEELSLNWQGIFAECKEVTWKCPYSGDGGENWDMTGHLNLSKRCC